MGPILLLQSMGEILEPHQWKMVTQEDQGSTLFQAWGQVALLADLQGKHVSQGGAIYGH